MIIDEEEEANTIDSPFKSVINQIFHEALVIINISEEEALGSTSQGILKWLKYLTKYFMPTSPIWSNLLIGRSIFLTLIYHY
jgi:preprotein translocase subunit SecY